MCQTWFSLEQKCSHVSLSPYVCAGILTGFHPSKVPFVLFCFHLIAHLFLWCSFETPAQIPGAHLRLLIIFFLFLRFKVILPHISTAHSPKLPAWRIHCIQHLHIPIITTIIKYTAHVVRLLNLHVCAVQVNTCTKCFFAKISAHATGFQMCFIFHWRRKPAAGMHHMSFRIGKVVWYLSVVNIYCAQKES